MRKLISITIIICFLLGITSSINAATLTVDDDKVECPTADFTHPQDAVNAAAEFDTILVYPGTYGSRVYTNKPPHWGPSDQYAPALIVYKNGLTIQAVDPDPSNTTIESTHDWWSNKVAIQASTGGVWDGSKYVGAGVYPTFGTAPNAIAIMASNVTISGFTLRKPFMGDDFYGFWNTAGVMIGGLYAGDPDHLGTEGNTVTKCIFKDVWHAVYIWHSSDNMVVNNTVQALGPDTNHWAAISIYDGYNDDQINLGYLSMWNKIINNTIADKGIGVGAWAPNIWTDNEGTKVHGNSATQLGCYYSVGRKVFSGNRVSGVWWSNSEGHKFPGNSNHEPPPGWESGYGETKALISGEQE